ncbi:MAG: hypothetical protein IKG25_02880 [Mogibacterium sp.]|nr:hypothetical protein [Mogibacterium sp.]
MKSKNELFLEAVDYLIDEGLAHDQGDVALKAGLGPNLISRVRNGRVKSVSDDSIRALVAKFHLNMDYFRGKSDYITRYDQASANLDRELKEAQRLLNKDPLSPSPKPQSETPDYIQRLFDEAVRMSTRNELLERQCEQLIAELRDTKSKNEDFLSELRKSKEDNDAMVAELRISYEQNKALISELRETRIENRALTEKLEEAIDNIEGMKNQIAMMAGAYNTAQQPTFAPSLVNDKVFPEGFIRGGHTAITEELIQKAAEILQSKSKRK